MRASNSSSAIDDGHRTQLTLTLASGTSSGHSPTIIDIQGQYQRIVPVGPARRPKSQRCLLRTPSWSKFPNFAGGGRPLLDSPEPGRRLGSSLARHSSPASKLKILPDRSLLAGGPAEAGTGLQGSRDPRMDPFDDEFAFVLGLEPTATSPAISGEHSHRTFAGPTCVARFAAGAALLFFSRARLGGQEFRLSGGGESLPNAREAAAQPFAA